jgi:hypothetical protein
LEVFRGKNRFFLYHRLKSFKDTGGILDSNLGILAYFKHEHTWKPVPFPNSREKTRLTNILVETFNRALLAEMHEFPPEFMTIQSRKKWEIINAKKEIRAVVKEKPKARGSDWVLENPEGEIIASTKGDVDKKEYEIHNSREQIIARCYWDDAISEEFYVIDILDSQFDLLLVLSYIIILDFADSAFVTSDVQPIDKWWPLNEKLSLLLVTMPLLLAGFLCFIFGYSSDIRVLGFFFLVLGILSLILFVLSPKVGKWYDDLGDPM